MLAEANTRGAVVVFTRIGFDVRQHFCEVFPRQIGRDGEDARLIAHQRYKFEILENIIAQVGVECRYGRVIG